MERLCEKCGSLVSGDVKFCPLCGEPLKSAVDLGKVGDVMPPVQTNYNTQQSYGYSTPQYGQNNIVPVQPMQSGAMTTGQWFGTILLCTCLGIVSLIINIVWGFSSTTPEPKRSFCRAMLIFDIVAYVFAFLVAIIVIVVIRDSASWSFSFPF